MMLEIKIKHKFEDISIFKIYNCWKKSKCESKNFI